MILDYNRKPDATVDEKIQSLMENTQLALNDIARAQQSADVAKEDAQTSVALSQTARQAAADASDAAATAKRAADDATAAVEVIEGDVSGLTTRVTQAEADIDAAEGNITSLTGRVADAEGDITTIEGNVSSLTGRVADAEADISTAEGNISTLQSDVAAAEGNITTIQGNITNLSGRVSDAESDITTVEGDITSLSGRVSDAEDDVEDVLKGLALAEDVVGTLNWITAHSTVTTDTVPDPDTKYYIKHLDGTFEFVTDTTGKNPAQEGWYVLDEALQNYVLSHLALTNDGLYVMADDSEWKVQITDNGVYILDPNNKPANQMTAYGNIVGYEDETHAEINARSFALYKQGDESPYLNFEYLIDRDGYITERAQMGGTDQAFISFDTNTDSIESVKVNGVETPFRLSRGYGSELFFSDIQLDSSDIIIVKYIPLQTGAKDDAIAFTFGTRGVSNNGALSFAVGNGNCVEAFHGVAIGDYNFVNPNGVHSKAIGDHLQTVGSYQLVVGKYNKPQLDTAFEIGNGTGTNNRSNAFTVSWDGIVSARDKDNRFSDIFDLLRPVGSTYSTVDASFNPNDSWGGTWERLPEGYILLSGSESGSYQVGTDSTASGYKEYGENTHTLTESEIPSHTHGNKSLTGSFHVRHYSGNNQLVFTPSGIVGVTKKTGTIAQLNIGGTGTNGGWEDVSVNASHEHTSFGGGQAHSIMQKSIAVYTWIRTA